jgi:SAM-dependent methyltransferase
VTSAADRRARQDGSRGGILRHVAVARDGSPVDIYDALPPMGEPELIHSVLAPGSSILDLGCGTGRVAVPLTDLGHRVVGVDDSPDMLERLDPRIEPVLGDARTLLLGRRFDAVLLASHLLNDSDASAFLTTAAIHLHGTGRIVAEIYPVAMDWGRAVGRSTQAGPVEITVTRATAVGDRIDAAVRYGLGDRTWDQAFDGRMLDEPALRTLLTTAGFRLEHWLDERRGWFVAGPDGAA